MRRACAILALVAATLTTVSAQAQTTPLEPFSAISVCLPFNLVISPSENAAYQLIIDADPGVAAAVNASVVNDVLTLKLAGNAPNSLTFRAPNPIKVAIMLPADKLASVAVSSVPSIIVAVAPGFTVPSFSGSLSGTSSLTVQSLTADKVDVINAGTGYIYVAGKINAATASSSGTGTTYLIGVAQTAAVDASGISKVFVSGTAQTQITGQVSGISSVIYDQGICTVSSQFGGIFGSPCTQQPIAAPAGLTSPVWSCAVTVYGTFGCSDGTTQSSSSGGSSSSSSTSSGGGNTMTSNTVNGITTTTTGSSNPDGSSSLVTGTGTLQTAACPVNGAPLLIFPAA